MSAKREQILWKNVWPTAERLERVFSLKALCSAGILLFDRLSAEAQKRIIAEANGNPLPADKHLPSDQEEQIRRYVFQILQEAKAIPAKNKVDLKAKGAKSA